VARSRWCEWSVISVAVRRFAQIVQQHVSHQVSGIRIRDVAR
jgi:hypothetical protein